MILYGLVVKRVFKVNKYYYLFVYWFIGYEDVGYVEIVRIVVGWLMIVEIYNLVKIFCNICILVGVLCLKR